MRLKLVCAAVAATFTLSITGCSSTTEGGVVGAQRRQLLLVSSEQLDQMSTPTHAELHAPA